MNENDKIEDIDLAASFKRNEIDKLIIEPLNIVLCNIGNIDSRYQKYSSYFEEILLNMKDIHKNIAELIRININKPGSADAILLARQQIEWLFIAFLFLQDPQHWCSLFEQDEWQKMYMSAFYKKEWGHLEGFDAFYGKEYPEYLETERKRLKISAEKIAIMKRGEYIERFPKVSKIAENKNEKYIRDVSVQNVLKRLLEEYKVMSSIAHPTMVSMADRSILRGKRIELSGEQKEHFFQIRIIANSLIQSHISTLMVTTEIALLLKNNMHALIKCGHAWDRIQKFSLLGKRLYGLRYEKKLGHIN